MLNGEEDTDPVDLQGAVSESGDLVHIKWVKYPLVFCPRDELEIGWIREWSGLGREIELAGAEAD